MTVGRMSAFFQMKTGKNAYLPQSYHVRTKVVPCSFLFRPLKSEHGTSLK